MNKPPQDRKIKTGMYARPLIPTRPAAAFTKPVMSPEAPGYEEYLRRLNNPPAKK